MMHASLKTKRGGGVKMPPSKDKDGLTLKQRAFVEAYCGNATEAALAAGYSPNHAGSNIDKVLKNPKVKKALEERARSQISPLIASRSDRQKFWTETMANPKVSMKDRLKASDLLARSEGDYIERREISGPGGSPFSPPIINISFDCQGSGAGGSANDNTGNAGNDGSYPDGSEE